MINQYHPWTDGQAWPRDPRDPTGAIYASNIAKAAAPRFTLSGGRIVTDTVTGDRFALAGIVCRPTGAIEYDPTRLAVCCALARRIVDLLNEHGS